MKFLRIGNYKEYKKRPVAHKYGMKKAGIIRAIGIGEYNSFRWKK